MPCDGVDETKVRPAGNESAIWFTVASEGPLFVTIIVYAIVSPTVGAASSTTLVTSRSAEDDGYVVTFTTDTNDWKSYALIFDARDISVGPVAKIHMPHRMPAGFHTLWVPGSDMF